MESLEPVDLTDERQRVYEYVERHGGVEPARVRDALGFEPRRFGHHLSMLKRDGYLAERDGKLEIALEVGDEREVDCDGIAVTIRPARQDDIAGIVGTVRQVAREGTYIEAENVAQQLDYEESLLRHNEFESRVFFVATVEDEVVGWVHLDVPEIDKLEHTAELTVGIVEEYRGHGIGSRLLERGLEWAADAGLSKVYNSFPATNEAAIEFFEDHGGDIEAVRSDHYRIDGDPVDEVMMGIEV
ncbi:GNAT family N-acetyltransferase [Halorientalis litorea]|jgi:ribosomal protein S18 acetylase RimI-like enzyme|uniref:GNAT family N-acetyltransferase n=1 Tax=Halorientalis litorea TaxID=2931977 RepID=UPI001FF5D941|nr:GNAT family N-acetyltransferase [Halorientalis litorea]